MRAMPTLSSTNDPASCSVSYEATWQRSGLAPHSLKSTRKLMRTSENMAKGSVASAAV